MAVYGRCEPCGSQTIDGQCTNCYWRALDQIVHLTHEPVDDAIDRIRLIASEARDYGCLSSSSDTIGVRLRHSR